LEELHVSFKNIIENAVNSTIQQVAAVKAAGLVETLQNWDHSPFFCLQMPLLLNCQWDR
jgi:hypothetical protein